MFIKNLELLNFRNYKKKIFKFNRNLNIIIGANGSGKTNVLEAIYILSQGKSWRSHYDYETIREGENYLNIKSITIINKQKINMFIALQKGVGNRSKKAFKINNVSKSMQKFTGTLKSVLFSPDDLEIITGAPSKRRLFLNDILKQTDNDYKRNLANLKKVISSRNKLLQNIAEKGYKHTELEFWDYQLLKFSNYITQKRKELIDYLNYFIKDNFKKISNTNSTLKIDYKDSKISKERLIEYQKKEIAAKRTLIGAQKEDLILNSSKNNGPFLSTRFFSSRGEQRTASFVLKLGALDFIKEKTKEKAILLLDDIYSELDIYHRKSISKYFKKNQIFITSSEVKMIPKEILKESKIYRI